MAKTPSKIIGIQFSMMSPEEIKRNSVVEITSRDTYYGNKAVVGGLFDPRMGVLEPGTICPTDGMSYIDTPGYFGHIDLARPVFFIQHLKEIIKICRCVCFKCSKLLINKTQHKHILNWSGEKRWDYITAICSKVSRCCGEEDGCGCKQPDKIKLEGMATLLAIWDNISSTTVAADKERVSIKMTPEVVLRLFKRISDDDVHFMGFSPIWSRPDWMICQVLPVAPPAVRPSVKHDAQQRSEDDLTHLYNNIMKYNKILKEKLASGGGTNAIEMYTEILQHSVAMIANNKIKGVAPIAQRSGRPLQCIMGRINSKNGRIRGNLMGKRVDFSARSVITGDPNLSIRQLGVPMKVAKNITKPVVVNDRNRDFLMKLVHNGPDEWPGAKIVERANGQNESLRYKDRSTMVLRNGDTVHRHMMDGDYVLFNRQPSLHRMSMMSHVVKVMNVGDTFRMNVGVSKPYNADFDGDEMNMHMPQNITAETELRHLAAIPFQQISPTSNTPIIGIFQDSLLGAYLLTRPGVKFTQMEAMNLLMKYPFVDVDALRKCGPEVTSFQLLSQIFPKISLKYKSKLFDEALETAASSNNVFEVRNGVFIRGQIEKSILGSGSKGILHRIYNDFGPMACAEFNDALQYIVTEFMKTHSFSVGMSDLMASQKTHDEIREVIQKKKQEAQRVIDHVHLGIFENNTAHTYMDHFESQINNILNETTNEAGKIGNKSLSKDNRFVMIVESGSKGNAINITQMVSCLGQQNVDGKRISYGFDSRTLPHYSKYDDSPNARGFVENSYISGLTAPELFFHAMGGRIGLIDTAVKTSNTGYIQRRLVKALEDLKVEYDMTVRNNMGKIIQYAYGDDNFDSTKVESQHLPFVTMSMTDIFDHYDFRSDNIYTVDTKRRYNEQIDALKKKASEYIEDMILARDFVVEKIFKNKNEGSVVLPVAFQYIIGNVQGQLGLESTSAIDITPLEAFELFEEYHKKMNNTGCVKTNLLFDMMYKYYVSPHDLLVKKRFHKQALILLLETMVLKLKEALVHPGEMVGVVAAQSISEPSTQLTLNSVTYETEIVVRNTKGEIMRIQIGDFVSKGIEKCNKIDYMENADTTYAPLDDVWEVPCATENGQVVWRRIEAVTKHPVVNEDGTDTMIKVTTKGMREVIATKAKSFLQMIDGKLQACNGSDLKVGHYLPVSKKVLKFTPTKILHDTNIELEYDFGYFIGAYLASGKIRSDIIIIYAPTYESDSFFHPICRLCQKNYLDYTVHVARDQYANTELRIHSSTMSRLVAKLCGKMEHKKCISASLIFSNKECNRGIAYAYLSSQNGHIKVGRHPVIYLTSKSKKLMEDLQVIFCNMGHMGNIHRVQCMDYILSFEESNATKLADLATLTVPSKQELVIQMWEQRGTVIEINTIPNRCSANGLTHHVIRETLTPYNEIDFDKIVSIEEVKNTTAYAYDLTVEDTRNFNIYNGLCLRDTFHSSGISSKSNVTRGVPRIEEILRLTKNPKSSSMTVYLKAVEETDKDLAHSYAVQMEHTKLIDVVQSVRICFDPDESTTNLPQDRMLLDQFYEFERQLADCGGSDILETVKSKWIVRLEMDAEKLLDKNITMDDIHFAISNSHYGNDVQCVYSDYNMDNLVFRIRMNASVFAKKKKGGVEPLDQSDEIYILKNFQDALLHNIVLRGLTGIKNVQVRKMQNMVSKREGKYEKAEAWHLDTTGTNLLETLGLDYIDYARTYSNDIKEIFNVLGIEAARQSILRELSEVMEFSSIYINYHHLSVLCDRMACNKGMVSIFRSGLLNDNVGPIAKSTFEVHTEVLLSAARHAEFDHMRGVSANIMCGQHGCYGTGAFSIICDLEKMKELASVEFKEKVDFTSMYKDGKDDATDCTRDILEMKTYISSITKDNGLEAGVCMDDYDAGF